MSLHLDSDFNGLLHNPSNLYSLETFNTHENTQNIDGNLLTKHNKGSNMIEMLRGMTRVY